MFYVVVSTFGLLSPLENLYILISSAKDHAYSAKFNSFLQYFLIDSTVCSALILFYRLEDMKHHLDKLVDRTRFLLQKKGIDL